MASGNVSTIPVQFARKATANDDISTLPKPGLYIYYVTSDTPGWEWGAAVVFTIVFATWIAAQFSFNTNNTFFVRTYSAGAWTAWKQVLLN